MGCCHILFGRPWKYDRHAKYNGRLNKYTTRTNGMEVDLNHLMETSHDMNCTTIRICMVSRKKSEREMRKNQLYFTIIPRGRVSVM